MELGCFSTSDGASNDTFADLEKKESHADAVGIVTGNARKNGVLKDGGHSVRNSVNRFAIKKPPHRRSASPLNYFPRKKIDSFLKRKIRLLQEVGGMNSSLDETLGDSNPHYSRIAREKIAAREAARKAMEARKAAMVEASWCRILRAARIRSKEAEAKLEKAEKHAAEAFEAAVAMGVMMYDKPDCPRQPCEIETFSVIEGGSTHTITASFETAFEVDKEVAAAVKKAFIKLANCPSSSNREEFRDLLRKISENPDTCETDQELSEVPSECESDPGSEVEPELLPTAGFGCGDAKPDMEMKQRKYKGKRFTTDYKTCNFTSFMELVSTMLDRLKGLQEDELSSLAIIVATCGLNAALLEVENHKDRDLESGTNCTLGSVVTRRMSSLGTGSRRYSTITRFMDGHNRRKEVVTEVPSLDKFLVKHVSRLEREVQEARNTRKSVSESGRTSEASGMQIPDSHRISISADSILNLGSRDIHEAKNSQKDNRVLENGKNMELGAPSESIQDLGGMLVKQSTHPKKDTEEQLSGRAHNKGCEQVGNLQGLTEDQVQTRKPDLDGKQVDKENVDFNTLMTSSIDAEKMHQTAKVAEVTDRSSSGFDKVGTTQMEWLKSSPSVKHISRIKRATLEALKAFSCQDGEEKNETHEQIGLDKIFIKPVHRLEREKMQALEQGRDYTIQRGYRKQGTDCTASESLDKILVKHVSRLEKERMALQTTEEVIMTVRKRDQQHEQSGESLGEILVKHQSKLEKAKVAAAEQSADHIKHVDTRREARERELQEAWGGLSLGNSVRPHLSRLERDKAAWRRAEEEEQMQARQL